MIYMLLAIKKNLMGQIRGETFHFWINCLFRNIMTTLWRTVSGYYKPTKFRYSNLRAFSICYLHLYLLPFWTPAHPMHTNVMHLLLTRCLFTAEDIDTVVKPRPLVPNDPDWNPVKSGFCLWNCCHNNGASTGYFSRKQTSRLINISLNVVSQYMLNK